MTASNRILVWGLGAYLLSELVTEAAADILFNGKQPVKIGLGKQVASKIDWTDCSSKKPESFNEPPYSLDRADNCTVGPPTFGLECDGTSCTVVDETKLQRYLPGVRKGARVRLRIQEDSVELQSSQRVLRLAR